ncbi:MAG: hypothetical protein J0I21_15255 [Alphaproteobacteria bacterium]|nr:hypothetical protein [Alphaproteobacteria bacterium]
MTTDEPRAEARAMPILLGAASLAILYTGCYLGHPALPGNRPGYPLGWWSWFDQGNYLRSAQHLRALDLAPAFHWYPVGYALLAAPFTRLLPMHAFYFVDLAALLAAYLGFLSFARRLSVRALWAVPIFVLSSVADRDLLATWAEPWNTTASAGAIWLFLALMAAEMTAGELAPERLLRLAAIGALGAAIGAIRPSDTFIPALWVGGGALHALVARRPRWGELGAVAIGAAAVAVPFGALYLAIYGPHPSDYVLRSRAIGFVFGQLPWKTVVLLLQPRPWFPDGAGLAARFPWLVLAFAGILPAAWMARGGARLAVVLLAASLVLYWALFFSYVDLLPSGLWRYHNVHYFKWTWPGLGLFAFLWLRAVAGQARRLAVASLAAVFLLMCIRLTPVEVADAVSARMVQFAAGSPSWDAVYFGDYQLADAAGMLRNVEAVRGMPDATGVREIALRRPFEGAVRFVDSNDARAVAPGAPLHRWAARMSLGYPCWLPPRPCRRLAPRD